MFQANSGAPEGAEWPADPSPSERQSGAEDHPDLRLKHAERCLERARSQIDSTRKLFLAWLLAMPVLWIYTLEPKVALVRGKVEEALSKLKALGNVQTEIKDRIVAEKKKQAEKKQAEAVRPGSREVLPVKIRKTQGDIERIAEARGRLTEAQATLSEAIQFKLPGIELPMPLTHGLLATSGFLFWVIAVVAASRLRVLNLFCQALRIQIAELHAPRAAVDDIASTSPWWLAPLPYSLAANSTVTRDDLCRALGWERQRRRGNVAVVLFAVAAIAIQVRFCWLAATICRYADFSPLHVWALLILMVVLLLATCWALWSWIRPGLMSDRFSNEPDRILITRRDWIAGAIPVVPAAILLLTLLRKSSDESTSAENDPNTPAKKAAKRHDSPRFVRHAKKGWMQTSLSPGFHENSRSKIIHRVSRDKRIRRVSRLNVAALRDSSPSQSGLPAAEKPRVHLATASFALESAAEELLAAKDYPGACETLSIAIEHDALLRAKAPKCRAGNRVRRTKREPKRHRTQSSGTLGPKRPDFRIFDRLADISVRHGQPTFLMRAIVALTTAKKSFDNDSFTAREIDARIAKWSEPTSAWHQKRR
jgi:hypothetical protein